MSKRLLLSLILVLLFVTAFPIFYKTYVLELDLFPTIKQRMWDIQYRIYVKKSDQPRQIGIPIPANSDRISVEDSRSHGSGFSFTTEKKDSATIGLFSGIAIKSQKLHYTARVSVLHKKYPIPKFDRERYYTTKIRRYLDYESFQQKLEPELLQLIDSIEKDIVPDSSNKVKIAKAIFYFMEDEVLNSNESKDFREFLFNLEGNSYQKAWLFNYLCRRSGIPSRIVGGIRLFTPNNLDLSYRKSAIRYWNDIYLGGRWIPVSSHRDFFGEISEAYLPLFWDVNLKKNIIGDKHAKVTYKVTQIKSEVFNSIQYRKELLKRDSFFVYSSLYMLPFPLQNTMRIILLIPLGTVILSFIRNMIGLKSFGIFMPILLALFFHETSLVFGTVFFVFISLLGFLEGKVLSKIHLLALPRLSILLTLVVLFLVIFSILNNQYQLISNFTPAFFPIIITTIFIERFSIMMEEEGVINTTWTLLGTFFITMLVYLLFSIQDLQLIIFTYPEINFTIIAILLLLGRYSGYRISELFRFRELLK